jgi:DNA mismatch repair protein MutS2
MARDEAVGDSEAALARREAEAERDGRAAAERYLLQARAEVEAVVAELRAEAERAAAARAAAPSAPGGAGAPTTAESAARSRVEEMLRETRDAADSIADPEESGRAPGLPAPPVVGDRLRSRSLGVTGEVVEVRPGSVVVETRGMRFSLPAADLEPAEDAAADIRPVSQPDPTLPELGARSEVDLRGLRVDEIGVPLFAALDAAVVADLGRLVVIHGKGTGALKDEVSRLVKGDTRVANVRPGGFDEGGWGVTVLEFKAAKI